MLNYAFDPVCDTQKVDVRGQYGVPGFSTWVRVARIKPEFREPGCRPIAYAIYQEFEFPESVGMDENIELRSILSVESQAVPRGTFLSALKKADKMLRQIKFEMRIGDE